MEMSVHCAQIQWLIYRKLTTQHLSNGSTGQLAFVHLWPFGGMHYSMPVKQIHRSTGQQAYRPPNNNIIMAS